MGNKITFKKIGIATLMISGVLALLGDMIYGSKEGAKEYLFGSFIISVYHFAFTLFSIITLFTLIFLLLKKLSPIVLDKIRFEETSDNTTKEKRK